MSLAPIAFFAYRRPEHTRRSLESLARNEMAKNSELFIYCDAQKHEKDCAVVAEVRKVIRSKQWCGTVHIIEREKNLGLANSIISGVTELCDRYGKVIVLEDDLVLSPYFLVYMNTALDLYEHESKVMQISGYMFPVNLEPLVTDAIFLPFITSWGWATWQRAWIYFDPKSLGYEKLRNSNKLRYEFNLNNSYPYFNMLKAQIKGRIDSWAIRWNLSVFMAEGLILYPTQSFITNTGFDGSGTHYRRDLRSSTSLPQTGELQAKVKRFPKTVAVDLEAKNKIFKYLSLNTHSRSFPVKVLNLIKKQIERFLNQPNKHVNR